MIRLLAGLVALVVVASAGAHPLVAESPDGAAAGRVTCGNTLFVPISSTSLHGITPVNAAVNAALVGRMHCGRFQASCDMPVTRMTFRVSLAGAAGAQCGVALWTVDGNTKLLDSGVRACDNIEDEVITGLSAQIVQGNEYAVCFAGSVTATLAYFSPTSGSTVWNTYTPYMFFTATNTAEFNDTCTASVTPYACCTGADTGTCTGMPATIGTITASVGSNAPFVALSR